MRGRSELERLTREINALSPNVWNKLVAEAAAKLIAIHDLPAPWTRSERRLPS